MSPIDPIWTERWKDLLDRIEKHGRLRSPEVRKAMERLPRWEFVAMDVDTAVLQAAVTDTPITIPNDQTISAPHMVAILLEAAQPGPGDTCLEIGAGSGWLAALMAELVGGTGHVVSIEVFEQLATLARRNIEAAGLAQRVEVVHGDGSLGHIEGAPYDVIILSCAAPEVPKALLEQAASGSRVVAPIGPADRQELVRLTRTTDGWRRDLMGACAFVPLVGEAGY